MNNHTGRHERKTTDSSVNLPILVQSYNLHF